MKRHTWQKTVLEWDTHQEWITNVPVDDLPQYPGTFHFFRRMKAVSIPGHEDEQRTAVLTFEVVRGVIGPTTRKKEILETFKSLTKEDRRHVQASARQHGTEFKVTFNLTGSFCEEVIGFIREVMARFGISDPTDYLLGGFKVSTESMHRQGEGWIPYTEYLKIILGIRIGGELSVEVMPTSAALQ